MLGTKNVRSSNQSQKLSKPWETRYFVARKLNQGSTVEGSYISIGLPLNGSCLHTVSNAGIRGSVKV